MREIRPSGSEGGGAETNRPFLPLSLLPLVPKLLFGNALLETLFRSPSEQQQAPNRDPVNRVPKREFGNE